MLDRWQELKQALIEKRSKLGEHQSLQQFSRDGDEIEAWISEKLQAATDETYKEPANIQSKHQKHQAFEAELAANADRWVGNGIVCLIHWISQLQALVRTKKYALIGI